MRVMHAYYDPHADIAWLPTGSSERVVSEEVGWGLIDHDEETDQVVAFEIWAAGKRLPRALIDALPGPSKSRDHSRSTTLHYDPEVDIASICIEEGPAVSDEYPWGLIDRDPDTDKLMGFVIWKASTVLPAEMIDALRPSNKPHDVAA
jgi:uncharacterized protein YuzE